MQSVDIVKLYSIFKYHLKTLIPLFSCVPLSFCQLVDITLVFPPQVLYGGMSEPVCHYLDTFHLSVIPKMDTYSWTEDTSTTCLVRMISSEGDHVSRDHSSGILIFVVKWHFMNGF